MNTQRIAIFLLTLMMTLIWAGAQPRAEIFGGYSYLRLTSDGLDENLNGWNVSVAGNLNSWFGLVADFSGHFSNTRVGVPPIGNLTVNGDTQLYLFGPRFTQRSTRLQPFVHALFGAARFDAGALGVNVSGTDAALALGGGIDLAGSRLFGWRIIQAEYILTRFFDDTQNNIRLGTGIVVRF